jgi:hypothetical protein
VSGKTGADAREYFYTADVCRMAGDHDVAAAVTLVTIILFPFINNQAITVGTPRTLLTSDLDEVRPLLPRATAFLLMLLHDSPGSDVLGPFSMTSQSFGTLLMCSYSLCSLLPTPRRCFLSGTD